MHPCALEIVKGGVCPGVRSGGIVVVVEEVVVHRGEAFVEVEAMVETLNGDETNGQRACSIVG